MLRAEDGASKLGVTLLAATCCLGVACVDEAGGVTSEDVRTAESFAREISRTVCDELLDCEEYAFIAPGPECAAEFQADLESQYVWNLPDRQYDASAGAECINLFRKLCTDPSVLNALSGPDSPCANVLRGTIAINGDCPNDAACQAGLYCNTSNACPGVCAPPPNQGEYCPDYQCAAGLYCDIIAVPQTCTPFAEQGDPCGDELPRCAFGMVCDDAPSGTNTCRPTDDVFPPAPLGQPCSQDSQCATSQFCDFGLPTPVCTERRGAGEACYIYTDECASGYHCDVADPNVDDDGVCAANLPLGSACDSAVSGQCGYSACLEGTCRYPEELGAACTSDVGCYSRSCENGACAVNPGCEFQ